MYNYGEGCELNVFWSSHNMYILEDHHTAHIKLNQLYVSYISVKKKRMRLNFENASMR